MKKGFTLIELLAVMLILTALILIISPVINNALKESRSKISNQNEQNIILGAKNWAVDNQARMPASGNEINISVEELNNGGYIENNATRGCVTIKNENNVIYYQYDSDC